MNDFFKTIFRGELLTSDEVVLYLCLVLQTSHSFGDLRLTGKLEGKVYPICVGVFLVWGLFNHLKVNMLTHTLSLHLTEVENYLFKAQITFKTERYGLFSKKSPTIHDDTMI